MVRCVTITLLTVAVFVSCQQEGSQASSIGPALQAALDSSVGKSPAIGASAAVMFADGELWAGTAGTSYEGAPMTADMLFDIASTQKNLQAALAMKLVQEGVMSLDDPLEKWLPPIPHVDGTITIRQLLNMTSGINDFVSRPNSPFRVGYVNIDFGKRWTWEEIQAAFIGDPSFEPGAACEYSSTNYIVLKRIIEKATGSKQSKLLEDKLLRPNRMDHTVADFSKPFPGSMRVAHGWFDTNDDGTADDIFGDSLDWLITLSPMLVYSTPTDMVKWLDALYHRKTVLTEETLKQMLDFVGPVRGEPLMKGYGLGTVDVNLGLILPRWESVRMYGHLGNAYGYMTFAGYFPDYGVSVAIMSNRGCDEGATQAIMAVGGAVLDSLLGRLQTTQ